MGEDANLDAALLAIAEEDLQSLSEHPSPEELLDYHLGTLDSEDQERLRDHLTLCATCADAVLDFAAFPDLAPPAGTQAPSKREVAREWRRLNTKLEAAQVSAPTARRGGWRMWKLAASFFAAGIGLTLLVVQLGQDSAPRADIVFSSLAPREEEPVRGAPETVAVPAWADRVVLVLSLGDLRSFTTYRLEMSGHTTGLVWTESGVRRAANGTFTIEFDRRRFAPDHYRIALSGVRGQEQTLLATYDFVIQHD